MKTNNESSDEMKFLKEKYVNKKVHKISGKPFKSRNKINTIKDICVNPHTQNVCFCFYEDSSFVDVKNCKLVEDSMLNDKKY